MLTSLPDPVFASPATSSTNAGGFLCWQPLPSQMSPHRFNSASGPHLTNINRFRRRWMDRMPQCVITKPDNMEYNRPLEWFQAAFGVLQLRSFRSEIAV